jgi:hypothetical protein
MLLRNGLNGGRSSAFGLTSLQTGDHLTPRLLASAGTSFSCSLPGSTELQHKTDYL